MNAENKILKEIVKLQTGFAHEKELTSLRLENQDHEIGHLHEDIRELKKEKKDLQKADKVLAKEIATINTLIVGANSKSNIRLAILGSAAVVSPHLPAIGRGIGDFIGLIF